MKVQANVQSLVPLAAARDSYSCASCRDGEHLRCTGDWVGMTDRIPCTCRTDHPDSHRPVLITLYNGDDKLAALGNVLNALRNPDDTYTQILDIRIVL